MALLMVIGLAACGGTPENGKNADGKFVSIDAFLNDPEVKPEIDSMIEALVSSESGMTATVAGDGDKLIYSFTFSEDVMPEGTDLETIKTALEANISSVASTFEGVAAEIANVVDIKDPKVVVAYNAPDGTEIFSQEFSAK